MDYFQGFRALSQDPDALTKLLVASLLMLISSCIPVLPQLVVIGWVTLALRRAVQGDLSLPSLRFDLDYFGRLLVVGFRSFAVAFVWSIPLALVTVIVMVCAGIGGGVLGATAGGGATIALILIAYALAFVGVVLMQIPLQAATLRTELTGDLHQGFELGAVVELVQRAGKDLLVANVLLWLLAIPLVLMGTVACGVGVYPAVTLWLLASAHVRAQVYQRYVQRGGTPLLLGATHLDPSEPVLQPNPITDGPPTTF